MLSICVLVSFNVATKGRVKICGQDLHLLVKQTAFNLDNDLYFYASLTLWYFSFPIWFTVMILCTQLHMDKTISAVSLVY